MQNLHQGEGYHFVTVHVERIYRDLKMLITTPDIALEKIRRTIHTLKNLIVYLM